MNKIPNSGFKIEKVMELELVNTGDIINGYVSMPIGDEPEKLKMEDVWGKFDKITSKKISKGMIVARSEEQCPHFGDEVPYKSVTVVCSEDQVSEVIYWLDYVQGGDSIVSTKEIGNNKLAIRSDYMCW